MKGLQAVTDADFPGYSEAVAHENCVRGAACLGLAPDIGGLTIKPLSAYHVRILASIQSPFLLSVTAEQLLTRPGIADDILSFLWIVSPMFEPGSVTSKRRWIRPSVPTARDRFNAAFAQIQRHPALPVIRQILDYISEAYLDSKEPSPLTTSEKSYFAFELSIADELREYGFRMDFWNPACPADKNPLHVPLKIVFQLRKLREFKAGEIVSNRSEQFISKGLANFKRN